MCIVAAAAVMTLVETPSRADSTEVARSAIRSALEEWRLAFNDRDEHRVCDLFAPDLIANYQGQPERDYASLCQLLRMSVQDPEKRYRYTLDIKEILVFEETAIARLMWTLEIERTGAPHQIVEEPSLDIFRRQDDGDWKISRYLAYPSTP
jgi:uncharacterized protein (TIGR02246 family)